MNERLGMTTLNVACYVTITSQVKLVYSRWSPFHCSESQFIQRGILRQVSGDSFK